MSADRNLLFGVLALQADLLDASRFAEACSAWAGRKDTSLADLLVERGWLTPEDRTDVDRLLERKLKKHGGDAHASLAAATTPEARRLLAGLEDPGVQESLAALPPVSELALVQTGAYQPRGRERYTLTRLHAQGGIGQVWLARDCDLGREVALKELRTDQAGHPALRARFVEEAQITGQLQHPGIVPVYELAQPADGQEPFYTMRFVRGRTLTEASRAYHKKRRAGTARPLDLRELLGAFVGVCNALAYAHSRGVIHRDLKGHNVLLGDFGEVMVVDWGLAKVTGQPEDQASLLPVSLGQDSSHVETVQGQALGTPGYMSPEQAEGRLDRIDARSDVYGLGAVLYEILTAEPPFTGPNNQAVLDRVVREVPVRPRQRVPATPPALEAICLKALAKRPRDRYASVQDLARDVERFLADEPVSTWREPMTKRLARWGRRHRPLVAGTLALLAAALVALTAGTILLGRANAHVEQERAAAARQRDLATQNASKARQAVNDYFTTVSENTLLKSPLPGLQPLRKELLQTALTYYQEFVRVQGDDPALRSELAAAYLRMGKITNTIGSKEEALELLQKSLALYRELDEAQPGDVAVRRGLAESLERVAYVQSQTGRAPEAVQTYRQALAVAEPLAHEHPEDLEMQFDLATTYNGLGLLQSNASDPPAASASLEHARAILKTLTKQKPEERKYRNMLAGVYSNIGDLQLAGLSQFTQALRSYQDAVVIQEKLAQEDPTDVQVQDYLSTHYSGMANAYFYLKRWPQCLEANQKSVAICENLARENPRVTRYQSILAQGYVNLGQVLGIVKQVDKSLVVAQQGIDLMERGLRELPNEAEYHWALGQALQVRALGQEAQQRHKETAATLERAITHQRQAAEKVPDNVQYNQALGRHYQYLGRAQSQLGETAKARESWKQAAQVWEAYASAHPANVGFRHRLVDKLLLLAELENAGGLHDDALATRRRALQVAEDLTHDRSDNLLFQGTLAHSAAALGQSLAAEGRPQEALPPLRRAVEQRTAIVSQRPSSAVERRRLASDQLRLGVNQGKAGQSAEALQSLRAAQATLEQVSPRGKTDACNLACVSAQLSLVLGRDHPDRSTAEADRAIQALREAIAAGYQDAERLEKDPDLEPLRSRADFQQLVAELKKTKTKP
jgi:serine/threonine-protein kinase